MPSGLRIRPCAIVLLVAVATAAACTTGPIARSAERSITLLTINDVYRIEGLDGGQLGGLARLRTLRADLEAAAPGRVLLLHAGDVIFPSLLSRVYKGRQMIDVLNLMDGDATPGRIDARMFAVFGNHEFDDKACGGASPLQQRVAESDFVWLHGNVAFTACPDGQAALIAANLAQARIADVGGLRVGLFGLTIDSAHPGIKVVDPLAAATALTADLRRRGADIVIAVTHLPAADDLRIYQALRERGLDLVVGGHDHEHMALPADAPRIFKADADAATAWVLTLTLAGDGRLRVAHALRELKDPIRPDAVVGARVATWLANHEREFCDAAKRPAGCLGEPLATAETAIVAEEEKIRAAETSLGNWVTDLMRETFGACGAGAAFINAGSLRLNHDLSPRTVVTRRHVEELMPYPAPLHLVELSADQLVRAVDNAVSRPGAGRWLQVSGLAFVHDPETRRVTKLYARPAAGRAPVDVLKSPAERFRVVVNRYLTEGYEDGYVGILPTVREALPCAASGADLKALIYERLREQRTIAPRAEGRICTVQQAAKPGCLAEAWGGK